MIKAVGDTEVYSAYQGSLRLQPKGRGAQHSLRQAFQRRNPGNYIKELNANVFLHILKCNFAESWRDESVGRVNIRMTSECLKKDLLSNMSNRCMATANFLSRHQEGLNKSVEKKKTKKKNSALPRKVSTST